MLQKYCDYIKESSNDWKSDLMSSTENLISNSNLITKDQIEDYFLELIDSKFEYICNLDVVISNGQKVSRKIDFTSNKCYPEYNVKLSRDFQLMMKTI